MMKTSMFSALLLCLLTVTGAAFADQNDSVLDNSFDRIGGRFGRNIEVLGQTEIGRASDRDVIPVHSCQMGDRVLGIKMQVFGGQLDIYRVSVEFGNGESRFLNIGGFYRGGDESRWQMLRQPRCVRSITIWGNGRHSTPWVRFIARTI